MSEAYKVLEILERTRLSELNRVERYYLVRARTAKGTLFSVELAQSQIDPRTSTGILEARAKELDALKG